MFGLWKQAKGRKPNAAAPLPWFGPLANAPTSVVSWLQKQSSFQVLQNRGLPVERTIVFAPERAETHDAEVAVLGTWHAWDDHSPIVWLFSTIGLSSIEQPESDRFALRRFELVVATRNHERVDPFQTNLGSALGGHLPEWDWDQVIIPPLMKWLAWAAQEFASWSTRDGLVFGSRDTVADIGLARFDWTRSALVHGALLPPPPQLLDAGFGPYRSVADRKDALDLEDWFKEEDFKSFGNGFYWFLPTSDKEHALANGEGTWALLDELVDQAEAKESDDDFAVAFDLLRALKGEPRPTVS